MTTQSLSIQPGNLFVRPFQHREFGTYVKPPLLVAYGMMSNALFWAGLMLPYGVNSPIFVAYLHVVSVLLGFAMAFGGSIATLMLVSRKEDVPYRSVEFAAGMLNISVLTATATMALAAYSRGTLALFT